MPLAAQLATLPAVAAMSGAVSVAGVLTNALAGPFVGPATVLGFAAAGLSLVSAPLAAVAGFGAAWCAQVIIWVAQAGAAFPGASWRWPAAPAALLVLVAAALLLACAAAGSVLTRWWLSVARDRGHGARTAQRLRSSRDGRRGTGCCWPATWARATVSWSGSGPAEAMLVDAGPDPAAIDRCLDQAGVTALPVVVLTHFHADHVDGLPGAVDGRRVGEIWVSPLASPPAEAAAVRALADDPRRAGPEPTARRAGSRWVGLRGRCSGPVVRPASALPRAPLCADRSRPRRTTPVWCCGSRRPGCGCS